MGVVFIVYIHVRTCIMSASLLKYNVHVGEAIDLQLINLVTNHYAIMLSNE